MWVRIRAVGSKGKAEEYSFFSSKIICKKIINFEDSTLEGFEVRSSDVRSDVSDLSVSPSHDESFELWTPWALAAWGLGPGTSEVRTQNLQPSWTNHGNQLEPTSTMTTNLNQLQPRLTFRVLQKVTEPWKAFNHFTLVFIVWALGDLIWISIMQLR